MSSAKAGSVKSSRLSSSKVYDVAGYKASLGAAGRGRGRGADAATPAAARRRGSVQSAASSIAGRSAGTANKAKGGRNSVVHTMLPCKLLIVI
jgi:hypothetical protein